MCIVERAKDYLDVYEKIIVNDEIKVDNIEQLNITNERVRIYDDDKEIYNKTHTEFEVDLKVMTVCKSNGKTPILTSINFTGETLASRADDKRYGYMVTATNGETMSVVREHVGTSEENYIFNRVESGNTNTTEKSYKKIKL